MSGQNDTGTVELTEPGEGICLIRICRQRKLNALSSAIEQRLLELLESPQVRNCRCLVIAGGERAFSAGADRNEMRDPSPEGIWEYYAGTGDMYERLADLPQPTIAAITGYCLGGGLELALAADLRVADGTAVFGLPEVSIGILPSSGGTLRLARILGPARTKELVLLGERFTAERALELGVITELVEPGRAEQRALELAARLAELPPLAVAVTKRAIDVMAESSRSAGLMIERLGYAALGGSEGAAAAAEAFAARHKQ